MNLLQKLDALEHGDGCMFGNVMNTRGCTCGLVEVRAAVHELVRASEALTEIAQLTDVTVCLRRVCRRNYVLAQFLDAQDDAR